MRAAHGHDPRFSMERGGGNIDRRVGRLHVKHAGLEDHWRFAGPAERILAQRGLSGLPRRRRKRKSYRADGGIRASGDQNTDRFPLAGAVAQQSSQGIGRGVGGELQNTFISGKNNHFAGPRTQASAESRRA